MNFQLRVMAFKQKSTTGNLSSRIKMETKHTQKLCQPSKVLLVERMTDLAMNLHLRVMEFKQKSTTGNVKHNKSGHQIRVHKKKLCQPSQMLLIERIIVMAMNFHFRVMELKQKSTTENLSSRIKMETKYIRPPKCDRSVSNHSQVRLF
jgi:hypothetical protein